MAYLLYMPHRKHQMPRFDAKSIGEEIESARVRLEIPVADIARKLTMQRTHWYKKIAGVPPFTWKEAGRIANEFHAPKGWPIVPWDEGLAWEAWLNSQR